MPKITTQVIVIAILVALLLTFLVYFSPLQQESAKMTVDVLYAGSLVPAMERGLAPGFKKLGYELRGEGHGSIQNANMVLDKQRFPDVFISAGIQPMKLLMESSPQLATWYIPFASDEIVIAYNGKSRFADELEKARQGIVPWYVVLSNPKLRFLRTDPELDPKGYYTVILAKLADIHYRDATISQSVLRGERNPDQIRPEETIMTLLQEGEADAVVAYKHEAVERELPFITLPPEINLGHPEYESYYRQASHTLRTGKKVFGEPVVFVVTIPTTSENRQGAIEFVKFLLSPEARRVMSNRGFIPVEPRPGGQVAEIPKEVAEVVGR